MKRATLLVAVSLLVVVAVAPETLLAQELRGTAPPAAKAPPVPAVPAAGAAAPAPAPPKVVLPTLEDTLREVIAGLSGLSGEPGVIAQVEGSEVYITLGSSQGVKVGDEFEVARTVTDIIHPVTGKKLSEKRDVAGRLKVTSVQPDLAVCALVSGSAEQKNARGEFCKVLPAAGKKPTKVAIGPVNLDPAAGVSQDDIGKALGRACAGGSSMQIVPPAAAEYELRLDIRPADGKTLIKASLIHLQSDTKVASAEGYHKTTLTLKDLGYHTAAVVDLKANLLLDPIYESAKLKMTVKSAGNVLFFPSVGADQHTALVYGDGRIIVATKTPLTVIKVIDQLGSTVDFLCGILRSVQGTLPGDIAATSWRDRSRIFADDGRIFRQIQFWSAGAFEGILTVPKYDVREVRAYMYGWRTGGAVSYWWTLSMDGGFVIKLVDPREFREHADVTSRFSYGEHMFTVEVHFVDRYFLAVQVLSAPTDLWPTIRDKSNNSLGTLSPVCGSMDELTMPAALLEGVSQ